MLPAGGGEPGSDPDWLRRQLLERYNVKHVILNGGNILGLGTLPDGDYATALARAYNDWTIDFWLTRHNPDGRFKSSLFVAPQDPSEAAKEIDRVGDHPHIVQVLFTSATESSSGPFHQTEGGVQWRSSADGARS